MHSTGGEDAGKVEAEGRREWVCSRILRVSDNAEFFGVGREREGDFMEFWMKT